MLDKVDLGERGVLSWKEAFEISDIGIGELLRFAETSEEVDEILIAWTTK